MSAEQLSAGDDTTVLDALGEPLTREQLEALAVLTHRSGLDRLAARRAAGLDPLPDADTDPTPAHGIAREKLRAVAERAHAGQTASEALATGNGPTAPDPARFVPLTPAELVALPWLLDPDHLTENGRAVSNLLDAGYVIVRPVVEQ